MDSQEAKEVTAKSLAGLDAIVEAVERFESRLYGAIARADSGWHRISVKVDRGEIRTVQVVLDENIAVDKPENSQ